MNIRQITPDIEKAKNLLSRAEEFRTSIAIIKEGEASFLLNVEYDINHALAEAILAHDGEKIIDKDHHKALIERIKEKCNISDQKAFLFDELRKVRNDINYYGQKDKKTLEDFYERNKESIAQLREELLCIINDKIKK